MLKKHKFLIILLLSLSIIFLGKNGWCAFEYMDGKLVVNGFMQSQVRVHIAQQNPNNVRVFTGEMNNDINMFRNHLQLEINYQDPACPNFSLFTKIKYINELNSSVDSKVTGYDAFPVEYPGDMKLEDDNHMVQIQELYADITAGNWWLRLGKQQVSWGQTDGFILLDIINPNDLSWRLISDALYEGHDNVRESLWMIRANYNIPFIDFVDNPMLELLFLPTFVQKYVPEEAGNPYNIVTTVLKFHHEHPEGEEWGAKFSGIWKRLEFSLNYFRGYSDSAIAIIPGTIAFDPKWGVPLAGDIVPPAGFGREDLVRLNTLGRHPLMHDIGFAFSYDDTEFLGGVWRVEFLYEPDRPYERGISIPGVGTFTNAMTERIQTVKYMVGFDRPTFIKFLNPRRTFSLGFQLFQTLIAEDFDQLDDDFITLNGSPVQSLTTYMTFLIDTQYSADRIHPILFGAYDPRGGYWIAPQCEFLWGDHWRFYVMATFFGGGDRNTANDSLGALYWWDDLMFRVTYQF